MITIAICDDNKKELEKTVELCHVFHALHKEYELRIRSFISPNEMNEYYTEQEDLDILLLDIYMPEMNGIDLAHTIRERKKDCQIIFLTTSHNHAIEAFSLHAVHYLVKPFTQELLETALLRAINLVGIIRKTNIVLKSTMGLHKLRLSDIIYTETDRHIQHIHLEEGKKLQVRISSSELYEKLSQETCFYKCGSTYIINLDKVEEVTSSYIKFDNGMQLPMQRRQYRELTACYTRHALGGTQQWIIQ